jgi:Fe-S-cluster-containing dehydrogenase component
VSETTRELPGALSHAARPGFSIDPEKCTECQRCMSACALAKTGRVELGAARIVIERRWPETPALRVCRFDDCPGQPCITSCPVEAIVNRRGYVLIDREACTGCAACLEACPFGAIRLDREERAYKCDFCAGEPACLPECLTLALRTGSGAAAPSAGASAPPAAAAPGRPAGGGRP